jgi:hypothetical protein
MKKAIVFLLFVIIATVLVITAQVTGLIKFGGHQAIDEFANNNSGKIEVVCDVEAARPVNGLGQPPETSRMTLAAGADFDENTGWYTGEYAISTNRKGTLKIDNAVIEVSRPALFSRYGVAILGEHFTLDRSNGQFKQWLDLKDNKKIYIVTGTCKRSTRKID